MARAARRFLRVCMAAVCRQPGPRYQNRSLTTGQDGGSSGHGASRFGVDLPGTWQLSQLRHLSPRQSPYQSLAGVQANIEIAPCLVVSTCLACADDKLLVVSYRLAPCHAMVHPLLLFSRTWFRPSSSFQIHPLFRCCLSSLFFLYFGVILGYSRSIHRPCVSAANVADLSGY